MALIREFERKTIERASLHEEIKAKYAVVERDGRMLLQIDTYGRPSREHPEKVSQSLQFDRSGAERLYNILKREFNFN
jgi:hypothetical protein